MWKQLAISAYFCATLPYRYVANRVAARRGQAPVIILFYHRVADHSPNPWTISNAAFERQIRWMQDRFDMVSLEEAQQRIRSGVNHQTAVSVTFDDGYADNYQFALPLLIERQIPCTYFVSTQHVVDDVPFPHDVAIGQALLPNTVEQLRTLSEAGVEIGGHTRTHADLGKVRNPIQLAEELIGGARDLEELIGRHVKYFAFPFGLYANLNADAFYLARDHGLQGVCSAYGGYNFPGDDAFHLQRVHADAELIRLKNWLTVDPRKCRVKRFEYKTCRDPMQHPHAQAVPQI